MENIIFGIRPVAEAVEARKQIERVYIKKGAEGQLMNDLKDLMARHHIHWQEVPIEKLNRLTRGNHQGVVAQIGTPQEIYYHPASEFVADFIGEANFLKGNLSAKDGNGGIVTVEGHKVPVVGVSELPEGKECTLVLRPESAVLADSGVLPCKVIVSCFMGSYQNYHVMVGDTLVKITDYNPRNKKIYAVGDTAWVAFEK